MAIPCEIYDMVPATLGAASHNRRIRTRRVRLLWLGGIMVPAQEKRFPVWISLSFGGLKVFFRSFSPCYPFFLSLLPPWPYVSPYVPLLDSLANHIHTNLQPYFLIIVNELWFEHAHCIGLLSVCPHRLWARFLWGLVVQTPETWISFNWGCAETPGWCELDPGSEPLMDDLELRCDIFELICNLLNYNEWIITWTCSIHRT